MDPKAQLRLNSSVGPNFDFSKLRKTMISFKNLPSSFIIELRILVGGPVIRILQRQHCILSIRVSRFVKSNPDPPNEPSSIALPTPRNISMPRNLCKPPTSVSLVSATIHPTMKHPQIPLVMLSPSPRQSGFSPPSRPLPKL